MANASSPPQPCDETSVVLYGATMDATLVNALDDLIEELGIEAGV